MRMFQLCVCGEPLKCNEAPTPEPAGTEVLLKVLAAGVCHSDLHLADGWFDLGGDWTGREGRPDRCAHACASVDRLRHLRRLPARRGESLSRDEKSRSVL